MRSVASSDHPHTTEGEEEERTTVDSTITYSYNNITETDRQTDQTCSPREPAGYEREGENDEVYKKCKDIFMPAIQCARFIPVRG